MKASLLIVTWLTCASTVAVNSAHAETRRIQLSPRPVAVVSETKLKPGDDPGHELVQQVRTDRIVASSEPEFRGAEVTVYSHMDLTKGNGVYRGTAIIKTQSGHVLHDFFEGRITTIPRDAGAVVMRFQGTHRLEGGTGKFAAARGVGAHAGKIDTEGNIEMDSLWTLDY